MPTTALIDFVEKALKEYKKRFLTRKNICLDEASTRLMVNEFLISILGYTEFEDIKTEYSIAGSYADYVIQMEGVKHLIVEVKSVQLNLNEKHLRQAVNYAANEGIDWILLTNGSMFILHRVIFGKPISTKKVFQHDLSEEKNLRNIAEDIALLTKKCIKKKELEKYWERFEVVEPSGISKLLYYKKVVSALRRLMKQKTKLSFSEDEVLEATHNVITHSVESTKPTKPVEPRAKKSKTKESESEDEEE